MFTLAYVQMELWYRSGSQRTWKQTKNWSRRKTKGIDGIFPTIYLWQSKWSESSLLWWSNHRKLRTEVGNQQNAKKNRAFKVNSVQEACAKCFAVHILKFEILQITWKKWNKEHQTLSLQFFTNRSSILMFFVLFFHVVCKISNFNMWTAKHLTQGSCTEFTLHES